MTPSFRRIAFRDLSNVAFGAALWALALYIVVTSILATIRYTHQLPFSDQWDLLVPPSSIGERGVAAYLEALVAPHNEHRLALVRLINGVDFEFFGYLNEFNAAILIAAMGASAALLIFLLRGCVVDTRLTALYVAPVAMACVFNGAQSQNLTWALGLQWHLTNVFFLGALVALMSRGTRAHISIGSLAASVACAILATLSSAQGLLVWPLVLAFVLWRGLAKPVAGVYAVLGAVAWALYLFEMPENPNQTSPMTAVSDFPIALAGFVARFAGHPWFYAPFPGDFESVAIIAGLSAMVAVGGIAAWEFRRRGANASPIVMVCAFVLATASLAALGRVPEFGAGQALTPRYGSASGLMWAALLGFAVSFEFVPRIWARVAARIFVLCALAWVAGYQPRMVDRVAEWHRERELAALTAIVEVRDEVYLHRVYPDVGRVLSDSTSLRAIGKSVFSNPRASFVGRNIAEFARADGACFGGIDPLLTVRTVADGTEINHRISGWGWDRTANRAPADYVVVRAADGLIVGLASAGDARPDVTRDRPELAGHRIGWSGVARPVGGVFNVHAVVGAVDRPALCIL
jgi:hypothetical protein